MLDKYDELSQDIIAIKNLSLCFPNARIIYDDIIHILHGQITNHTMVFWGANKGKWRHLSGLIAHMINKEYLKKLFEYWDSKHVKVALHKLKSDVLTWVIGQDPQITFSDFKKQQTENSSSTEFWLLYQYLEFYSPSE